MFQFYNLLALLQPKILCVYYTVNTDDSVSEFQVITEHHNIICLSHSRHVIWIIYNCGCGCAKYLESLNLGFPERNAQHNTLNTK